jgi:hypothetical protein
MRRASASRPSITRPRLQPFGCWCTVFRDQRFDARTANAKRKASPRKHESLSPLASLPYHPGTYFVEPDDWRERKNCLLRQQFQPRHLPSLLFSLWNNTTHRAILGLAVGGPKSPINACTCKSSGAGPPTTHSPGYMQKTPIGDSYLRYMHRLSSSRHIRSIHVSDHRCVRKRQVWTV